MELIGAEKSWEWSRKVRNASVEKAEQMMDDNALKTKREVGLMKQGTTYCIVKFYCKDCHKNHVWGGTKKYRLSINFSDICPRKSQKLYFMYQEPASRYDALSNAPQHIRQLIFKDEFSNIFT